ncbi:hypothetical protein [Actinomadura rupiterrae]|uniref:hypothetical protein n=1 Tax=Actinomadura rupiterrae TaxID=559627 RepID=UPI0020A51C64|nr:hypothetical protein [Actinomadura rupiterrae]MCP2339481.1 class 3 adenylate cyclase [Actinomadura rupiterrae]
MAVNLEEDLVYRLLLAVDIQGYSRLTARQQLAAQHDLAAVLDRAAAAAGLRRADWIEQVGGDGELAMLPAGTAPAVVAGDFVLGFDAALREVNAARDTTGRPGPARGGWRLRVRLALHHGTLTPGPFGPAGDAPVVVQRLLDSTPLRRLLDDPRRDLAVVVSDAMFADVVRSGFCSLPASAFEPVRVTAKGAVFRGHLLVRPPEPGTVRPLRERPARAAEGDPPVRLTDLSLLTGVGGRGDDLN